MNSATMIAADRLPFEILGNIFEHYVDEETFEYPLETMLLVCKSWSEAALGHRYLWGRLKIHLGHNPSCAKLEARLLNRLNRAGDSTPLEIDMRNLFASILDPQGDQKHEQDTVCPLLKSDELDPCECTLAVADTVHRLLQVIVGPNGSLCSRWTSLYLCMGITKYIEHELSYPTPNLHFLALDSPVYRLQRDMIPFAPRLRTLRISNSFIFTLPKLDNVRELEVGINPGQLIWNVPDLSNLLTATNVEYLKLEISNLFPLKTSFLYSLPNRLPHLVKLSFYGDLLPQNLSSLQAPNLRYLYLLIPTAATLQAFVESSLPSELKGLSILWIPGDRTEYIELEKMTWELLSLCNNLEFIQGEEVSLPSMLQWCRNQCSLVTTEGTRGEEFTTKRALTFDLLDGGSITVDRLEEKELDRVFQTLRLRDWQDITTYIYHE